MSIEELYNILSNIPLTESPLVNISVCYDHFVNVQEPPFILYRVVDVATLKADDKVHYLTNNYIVDLITDVKDVALETKLEQVFNNNNIPYDKEEDYLSDERIYQIRYFIS